MTNNVSPVSLSISRALNLFSAAEDFGGPQIAPADVEKLAIATGRESAQTMAHSSSADGVSVQLPFDRIDVAISAFIDAVVECGPFSVDVKFLAVTTELHAEIHNFFRSNYEL